MNWKVKLALAFANLAKTNPPKDEAGFAKMRKDAEATAKLGSSIFDWPVAVSKVTNISTAGIPMRIYQSSRKPDQRVIVYYHGGGFVLYGLDSHDNVCRRLSAMNNCIVVSVDYKLAPEHTFPVAHEEAFTALKWIWQNIHQYGGNPNDMVVAGDSAGGNLAACMAHRCRKENIQLTAQVLVYPWIDGKLNNPSIDRNGTGKILTKNMMFWFQLQYTPRVEDRCKPEVSPCYESDFTDIAPTFILTAELDPLIDDGRKYHEQLTQAGIQSQYKDYPQLFHGFFNVPYIDKQAMQAYKDIQTFLATI